MRRTTRAFMAAVGLAVLSSGVPGISAAEARKIEEVIVTAERREASISDTSISITAMTGEMLDDFGIRNQSDLQNVVPATTIQPYDSAIRGIGRAFRNLGGDPGVSTYMNGVYSEDLYTATIGSFWDLDRVEVLRGPQGTLYGRNAVGGAINFLYKKPSEEFEGSFKTIIGSYGTEDLYGMLNVPLIDGVLNGRVTYSKRRHDGWVEEEGPEGSDLDSGDEQNLALQLEWNINDSMTFGFRTNQADVDRTFGGADGGGLIVLSGENTVLPGNDTSRNYDVWSHRVRDVDPSQVNPVMDDFLDPSQPVLTYTNPVTGDDILAQRIRPGVDPGSHVRNHGRGLTVDESDCVIDDKGDIDGDDLCAYTNGLNVEIFDQQAVQAEFNWDISDSVSFKYIFGYNDLLYERITDDDSTASLVDDRQYYVNHEAEYVSHELQLFWDLGESMTFTSGVFFYDSTIDQRYDFYTSTGSNQFTDPNWAMDNILATVAPGAIPGDPALTFLAGTALIDVNSAKNAAQAAGAPEGAFTIVTGPWLGDASLGTIPHGIATLGSDLHATNKTEREAFAAYTQGVWDIDEAFTLTVGVRYAYDDVQGEENLARYTESMGPADALGLDLATINILRGAIDPLTLQPTGLVDPWLGGVPIQFGAFRELSRKDEKVTWRVNLDWNVTDETLLYANVTTGFRSGGFNLAFFSQTPEYEPEELIAYELGYKSRFLDNSLQVNGSLYYYDYESIHTFTEEACPPGNTPGDTPEDLNSACAVVNSTSSVQAAPGAEVWGLEFDVLWLATDNLTVGGNFSYTDTEYSESFLVVDGADPTTPGAIYTGLNNGDRVRDLKGNPLPRIPEMKASAYMVYNWYLGDRGNIDLFGSYSWVDEVYFAAFEDELDRAPAYSRVDLRATWTSAAESWVVSAFVNNVFNEIGIRQILRHGGEDGYRRTAQVSEPRVFGVELTYNLN